MRKRSTVLAAFEKRLRAEITRLRARGVSRSEIRAIMKRTEADVQSLFRKVYYKSK